MPIDAVMPPPSQAEPAAPPTSSVVVGLIADCLRGKTSAFDEIVRLHTSRIFNYVLHMTRHQHDAEDITQQTFIKAYTHLASFDPERSFIAWLLTIARRTALNHFRSARSFEPITHETASVGAAPDRVLEKHDQLDTMWAEARRVLPPRDFEVIWLRYAEDMSLEDTARIAGITQTHVKIIAFRARQRLAKSKVLS